MELRLVPTLIDNAGVQMRETEKMRVPWMAYMPVPRSISQQDGARAPGVGASPSSHEQGGISGTRLLPWDGEGGQPAYLTTYGEGSFVSRWADRLESAQLGVAERLLDRVESAWADRVPGTDMTDVVPQLCHALRDAVRVARSRGERMPLGERTGKGFPPARWDGPWAVAYRWPGDPVYVRAARRVLRRHLEQWGMTALAGTAELVLSELGGNAVRHPSGTEDRLIETRFERLVDGSLRIEVHDADESEPEPKKPSVDDDSGRGLLLVDALTGGRWGVSAREGVGKLVWAICAETVIDPVAAVFG